MEKRRISRLIVDKILNQNFGELEIFKISAYYLDWDLQDWITKFIAWKVYPWTISGYAKTLEFNIKESTKIISKFEVLKFVYVIFNMNVMRG